jgi:membrane protease YdiL (CAAX protease family)
MSSEGPAEGERRLPPAAARRWWGLGDAAAGFAIGLVLSAVVATVWLAATGDDELDLGGQALSQLGLWAGMLGCVVWASRRKGSGTLAGDFGFVGRWVDVVVGVVVGLLCQLVLVPVVAFLMRPFLGRPDISGPAEDLFEKAEGPATPILVLFVVVGAPVVEELFFRGLVLRSLERRFGALAAVLVSSAVFGMAHPQPLETKGLVLVMITLTALGCVLGALVVRTGRLGPSILAHATFNAWTAALLLT